MNKLIKKYITPMEEEMEKSNYLNQYKDLLINNHNLILTGAPGTGKTYLAKQIAEEMDRSGDKTDFVQFHPSYDYTDFVEGLRPIQKDNTIVFERKDGIFKKFCKKALEENSKKPNYVFIIDEINRGEISKIFGELFFAIDPGYRGKKGKIQTQYQNLITDDDEFYNGFFVPENVYIIGTMNDIDRSVESMDFAFRRRFAFKEITAEDSQKMLDNKQDIIKRMNNLNTAIKGIEGLNKDYQIGAAYFLKLNDKNFEQLWSNHLEGLLREYLRGRPDIDEKMKELKDAYDRD